MSATSLIAAAALAAAAGVTLAAGGASAAQFGPPVVAKGAPSGCGYYVCGAMVNGDGTAARKSGVTKVERTGEGAYVVRFAGPVRGCFWQAGVADPGQGDATPGSVVVSRTGVGARGLVVKTFDTGGQPADHGFTLSVLCDNPD